MGTSPHGLIRELVLSGLSVRLKFSVLLNIVFVNIIYLLLSLLDMQFSENFTLLSCTFFELIDFLITFYKLDNFN